MRVENLFTWVLVSVVTCAPWSAQAADATDAPLALNVIVEPVCPSVAPPLEPQSAIGAIAFEALATSLIGAAVDAAGAYFTGAATTKSIAFKGSVQGHFYSMNNFGDLSLDLVGGDGIGCLVLFVPGSAPRTAWFNEARKRSNALSRLDKLPQFYFEAAFKRSAVETKSLTVRSQFLHITEFQETGWSYGGERNYSVAITLRSRDDDQPFGSVTFDFSDVQPGTRGETQVINLSATGGTDQVDRTISATLNPAASSQQVAFFPVTPAIEAAAGTQKVIAAPFVKAARLVNKTPQEPVLAEPEWAVRSAAGGSAAEQSFVAKLRAFCDSLNQFKKDGGDPRCPVAHLQASNDLEEAKAALKAEIEGEWAKKFVTAHPQCQVSKGQTICTPPKPRPEAFGHFTWEATVVETREATAFAKAVESAFVSNKEKFKTELQNELPSKKAEVRQAAENTKRDALVTLRLAMLKVDEADAKLIEAAGEPRSAQLVLQADVLRAKVAANAAARAAGQAAPFDI